MLTSRTTVLPLLSLLCAGTATALPVDVHVMTFTNVPGFSNPDPYVEDGITVSRDAAHEGTAGTVHLDANSIPAINALDFTTGGLFQPISIDVAPLGSAYCPNTFSSECASFDTAIPYIWVSGYLQGVLEQAIGLTLASSNEFSTITLTGLIGTIDMLRVEARDFRDLGLTGTCLFGSGCGHFNLDNVTVRSVPEPATMSLLLSGLASLLLRRRRKL